MIIPSLASKTPAMLCILVTSKASLKVKSGNILGNAFESIVFPDPGGPIIRMLWPPAAAISSALFAFSCPLIYLKSDLHLFLDLTLKKSLNSIALIEVSPFKN